MKKGIVKFGQIWKDKNGQKVPLNWWLKWKIAFWHWKKWLEYEGMPKDIKSVDEMHNWNRELIKKQMKLTNKYIVIKKENDKLFENEFGIYFRNSSGELQFVKTFLNESRTKELEALVEIIKERIFVLEKQTPIGIELSRNNIERKAKIDAFTDIVQELKSIIKELKK